MWKVLTLCSNGVATAMFDKWLSLFAWFLSLFKLDSSTIEAFQKLRELTFALEYILIISRQFDFKGKNLRANQSLHKTYYEIFVICFFLKNEPDHWAMANFWILKKILRFFSPILNTHIQQGVSNKSNNQWTLQTNNKAQVKCIQAHNMDKQKTDMESTIFDTN